MINFLKPLLLVQGPPPPGPPGPPGVPIDNITTILLVTAVILGCYIYNKRQKQTLKRAN